uniref:TNF receptor-associated factor n=1 Tax=Sphaeramia orbicularis TaxID=375764 RepID=A0A673BWY9_9TELE
VERGKKRGSPCAPAGFLPLHGGFRDHFVETPEAKYCCEACRLVLCQPRQTECGHRFCQSCISDILRDVCFCNRYLKEIPDHLSWKCKHRESTCEFCMTKMLCLQKHKETVCPAFPVSCPNHCSFSSLPRSEVLIFGAALSAPPQDEVENLRGTLENLRTRLSVLEQGGRAGSNSAAHTLGKNPPTVHKAPLWAEPVCDVGVLTMLLMSVASLETQLNRHDDMLSVHEIRLADMDLRFQVLETASYNGTLIWKIRDYKRRKAEAVSGQDMCARVYLNGDGMGKGTHLSLFFVVMRGEYDALLPWPFRQKVTLMLMDQGTSRKHLGDAFKPDPNSSSFKRPSAEMNIASGCPLFVSQSVLETGSYIKDDTIHQSKSPQWVTVDTSDLPDP